jgi:soluble lytic murein transglycosylase-like protein
MSNNREKREVGRGGVAWQPTTQETLRSPVEQWEYEQMGPVRRRMAAGMGALRRPASGLGMLAIAFVFGVMVAAAPEPMSAPLDRDLRERLARAEAALLAGSTDLDLLRLEMARLEAVMHNSSRYRIPADLAADIYDIALSEGIDPSLAFRLVRIESGFVQRAVSPVGAVGLAQLMPRTAFGLDPSLSYADLFDRKTNLRLGFRYLRQMIEKYDGDLRLALLAYNRGPGTVDMVLDEGRDPGNGYASAVITGAARVTAPETIHRPTPRD